MNIYTTNCEGECPDGHGNFVQKVLVKDREAIPNHTFKFNYCEKAIEEDERRGFEVVIIDPIEQARLKAKAEFEPLDLDELEYINA